MNKLPHLLIIIIIHIISDYKNIAIKSVELKQIPSKYNCTVAEVKKKISNLRSVFHGKQKRLAHPLFFINYYIFYERGCT